MPGEHESYEKLLSAILPEIKSGSYTELRPGGTYGLPKSLDTKEELSDNPLMFAFVRTHHLETKTVGTSHNPLVIFHSTKELLPNDSALARTVAIGIVHHVANTEHHRPADFSVVFAITPEYAQTIQDEVSHHPEFIYYLLGAIYKKVGGLHVESQEAAVEKPYCLFIEKYINNKNTIFYPDFRKEFTPGFDPTPLINLVAWENLRQQPPPAQ